MKLPSRALEVTSKTPRGFMIIGLAVASKNTQRTLVDMYQFYKALFRVPKATSRVYGIGCF